MVILNLIDDKIKKYIVENNNYIEKYSVKSFSREVYIDSKVYIENKFEFVFLINTGDWFSKTIRFDIKINSQDNKISIRKGYGDKYEIYDKKDFKRCIYFIDKEIKKFYLKSTMVIIKSKEIVE